MEQDLTVSGDASAVINNSGTMTLGASANASATAGAAIATATANEAFVQEVITGSSATQSRH
jgi:hypothetical protein